MPPAKMGSVSQSGNKWSYYPNPAKKFLNIFRNFIYLRLSSFDLPSKEGRNSERYRKATLSSVANAFSRALGLILMVIL